MYSSSWAQSNPVLFSALADWIVDKDQSPWFFPSINEHLSKIPERIWYETDNTTNLNESAHPFTNQMTGTGRPLVESIEHARNADRMVLDNLLQCKQNAVLINTRNTFAARSRANRLRNDSRIRIISQKSTKAQELAELNELIKDAQQKKKSLTQQGVKALRAKRGSRGKNAPNAAEMRRSSSPCAPSSLCSASPASSALRSTSCSVSPSLPHSTNTSYSRAPTTYLARPSDDFAADFNTYDRTFSTQLLTIEEGIPIPPPVSQYAHWSPWFGSSMATPDVSAHPYTQPFDTRPPPPSQVFGWTPSAPPSSGIFGWSPQD